LGAAKKEVIAVLKTFFREGNMPPNINETMIVLIQKHNTPESLKDYRPIALCNVIYTVVVKCIVNRVRSYLDELISENQSAYIPGRLITDNALVAFECFHAIQMNKKSEDTFCAYKLDLSKAYERVDWNYLRMILIKFGFNEKFVSWIMGCVSSVTYKVRVSGNLTKGFKPTRGIRQGDPLSPYLILFVGEGLSRIIKRAVHLQELQDLKVCRRAPGISHLLFADDIMLFLKAKPEQAVLIKLAAIGIFEIGLGQLINPTKCSILFSEAFP
jgi:hypothetical protein